MGETTDPLASGLATTEGKVSLVNVAAGILVALLGGVVPIFIQATNDHPGILWLQLAAIIGGTTLAAVQGASYTKSRTLVKGDILDLLRANALAVGPLLAQALLKKYAASLEAKTPPASSLAKTPIETPVVRP